MSSFCEQEFMLKNFWFHHNRPILFVTPQFGPNALYPAWTAIQLIYHIIALSIDGYQAAQRDGEPTGNYLIYLPNWTYMVLVISSAVDCSVTLYVHCLAKYMLEEREQTKTDASVIMRNRTIKISYKTMGKYYIMKGYLKVSWIFFTLSTVTGLTVSLLYWTLFFLDAGLDVGLKLNASRLGEKTLDYGTLGFNFINALVILIHLTLTAKPFRLLHFYIPMTFFAVYFIFSVVYQTTNGNYIYKIFDWCQVFVTTGLVYGLVFILVPLVHLMVFGLVNLRIKIGTVCGIKYAFSKWKRKKIVPHEPEVDAGTSVLRWINSQSPHGYNSRETFTRNEKHVTRSGISEGKDKEQTDNSDLTVAGEKAMLAEKVNIKSNRFDVRNAETSL